jgi:predicted SprT family Zn-dependent metalloprotease
MDKRVRFNLLLLMEQHEDEIRMVAAHEFAHIATFKRWAEERISEFRSKLTSEISFDEVALLQDEDLVGPWPHHGPEWRRMMLLFGYPPKRCHHFDVTRHRLR